MKRPSQIVSFDLPKSHQIRAIAQKLHNNPADYVTHNFTDELSPLAFKIIALQQELDSVCDQYDHKWLNEKQKLYQLNREESQRLIELQRKERVKKEEVKVRKQSIRKLSTLDKRFYKQYGKTPEEYQQELLDQFTAKLESLVKEQE